MIRRLFTLLDAFGRRDPRNMPGHLLGNALRLDYSTAARADTAKQNRGVCPRHWYVDAEFRCARCHDPFVFAAGEQRGWYEELGFHTDSLPKRCPRCRLELRRLKALRQEYDRDVAAALTGGASLGRKKRLVEVLDALDAGGVTLAAKVREKRCALLEQIRAASLPPSKP